MRGLVYGHSQSGGMGLALVAALKAEGWSVDRITHNGYNDAKLLAALPGNATAYDHVWIYGGGNTSSPSPKQLLAMVAKCGGPAKVTVILPPYNLGKVPATILSDTTTKGYINAQALKNAGVPVYRVVAPATEFSDGVHLKASSPTSKKLAQALVGSAADLDQIDLTAGDVAPSLASASFGDSLPLILFAAALAFWWRRRRVR